MTSSPVFSSHLNAHMRRSQDDTKWLMYDGDNNSETWSDITEMTVDITQLKEFRLLTPALQVYVWTWAAHRFQKGAMAPPSYMSTPLRTSSKLRCRPHRRTRRTRTSTSFGTTHMCGRSHTATTQASIAKE